MSQHRPKAARTASELLSIQYLRGLAALTVLVSHTLQWPLPEMSQLLLRSGRLGVEVFFVISGFIITLVGGSGAFNRATFLRNRAWRIVPLYWGATLAVAALALLLPSLFRTTVPTPLGVLESLLFVPSEMPKAPLLGVGWTLDYEVFFYLVFALLSGLASEMRTLVICIGMAALIAVGLCAQNAGALQYFYTSPSLLGFAAGTLLAQAYRHGLLARLAATPRWVLAGLPLLLAGAFLAIPAADEAGRAPLYFHLVMTATAIAIVGGALVLEAARKLRPMAALHYLGDASYSIYLFHLFAVGAGWAVVHRLWGATPMAYLPAALAIAAIALLSGLAAHHLFERPLLALARSARKRGNRRNGAAQPPAIPAPHPALPGPGNSLTALS